MNGTRNSTHELVGKTYSLDVEDTVVGRMCFCTGGASYPPNVLEFDIVTQVPINVLEFMGVFLKTYFMCCYVEAPTINYCMFCNCC